MTVCDQPRKLHHTTWYTVHRTESARSLFHNYTDTDHRKAQVKRYLTSSFVLIQHRCLGTQVSHGGSERATFKSRCCNCAIKLAKSQGFTSALLRRTKKYNLLVVLLIASDT